MSEVRLVVLEAGREWSGTIHGGCADRAIAALSADPVTVQELELAIARFAKASAKHRLFLNLSPGVCDEPYDSGLVVIDLVARLVVVDSTYSSPGPEGVVEYHDGRRCTETGLPYHLAQDWLFTRTSNDWRALSENRRRERGGQPIWDVRTVFYGRPLLEMIARETFGAFAGRDVGSANPPDDSIKQIHATWLLTPRADLGGTCPREIALARRQHLGWDMQDRCEYWTLLNECPPGLKKSSHAFRYGGFGTHELIMYYDLVRELLWSCWTKLAEGAQSAQREALTVGDFLSTEISRLESVREEWLDTRNPEFHGRTPRSIIDRERARLPEGMSGHEAVVDPDCPCCQMLSDMPGPAFWGLAGSDMDDDFAFDIYNETREQWEEEERRREEFNLRFNAEWAERERLGLTGTASESSAIWSRSYAAPDVGEVPFGVRVFEIGCHLAELIVDLRSGADRATTSSESQRHIDLLNRGFGNFRELLQSADASLAEALIDPVLNRFAETLATVALARADLSQQCESVTRECRQLLGPPSSEPA